MFSDDLLPLLPSLVALVEEAGVTRAARRLGISQPRMSARLADLRRMLSDPLLVPAERKRGLLPTERAIELARGASASLRDLSIAFSNRQFDPTATDRTFRIMANENAFVMVGVPLVDAIRAAGGGNVRVALFGYDKSRMDELEMGELDLVLGRPHQFAAATSLITRTVVKDGFLTIVGRSSGAVAMDLDEFCRRGHVLISTNPNIRRGKVDEELAKLGRERKIVASVQSHLLAIELVAATDLIATLPKALLPPHAHRLVLLEPPLRFEPFVVTAAWHPRVANDAGHQWLRSLLFDGRC